MIQFQYMAPWVPTFSTAVESELAATDRKPPFTSFQFATVDSDGFPHNRTLVYRGFLFNDKSNSVVTFTTDRRMEKYQELLNNDKFEAVFYFGSLKKQFRLRGRARIIDGDHLPVIDLSSIQPKHLLASAGSSDSDSEEEEHEDTDNAQLSITVTSSRSDETPLTKSDNTLPISAQGFPISYPVISPNLINQLQQGKHLSYANLQDLSSTDLYPPTPEEYEQEIMRQWDTLLKTLRSTFRKPPPKTPLNSTNQNLIDKISRGVDGKKEESGLQNFAVVALFVDYVDFVEIEKDRRYIYRKNDVSHIWSEEEVCP